MLVSVKPEDREFGYVSFAALGYEETAIKIIAIKRDQSGREVLVQLKKTGDQSIKTAHNLRLHLLNCGQNYLTTTSTGTSYYMLFSSRSLIKPYHIGEDRNAYLKTRNTAM